VPRRWEDRERKVRSRSDPKMTVTNRSVFTIQDVIVKKARQARARRDPWPKGNLRPENLPDR